MNSLFILFFILDILFIAIISSFNEVLFLITLFPWTLSIYIIFCLKGFLFNEDDELIKLAGRLYWIGKGSFNATLIAIFNTITGALIVSDAGLATFEQQFGFLTSIFIFMFLPLPGFLILNIKRDEQERFYEIFYQQIVQKEEAPEFVLLTSELIRNRERYTKEYLEQLEKIHSAVFQFLEANYNAISTYFAPNRSFRLNSTNLALFLTKKLTNLDFGIVS